jgi:hypothetical protein
MSNTEYQRVADIGQMLMLCYGFFAVAAGSRAVYQMLSNWQAAPLAFSLSLCAALIYLLAGYGMRQRRAFTWKLTLVACGIELVGVVGVGILSIAEPALFPRATVWSQFGAGYFYLPLVLPILGIAWLLWPATRRAYRQ